MFAFLVWAQVPAAAAVTAVFEVDLRDEIAAGRFDPARDRVTLRGAVAPLSWQRGLVLEPTAEAGRRAVTVHFPRAPFGGQAVPHKFRIERPGQPDDDGWEAGANHAALLDGPAPRVARVFGAPAVPLPPRITGHVVTLDAMPSRHVVPRAVRVWLPPDYERDAARRYPVLYLHDGQNVFDASAAGAEWQADETAQRLVLAGAVPPMIIVAVPASPARELEYTPSAMRRGAGASQGGGLPAYARYLVDELKPQIDRRFRTRTGPLATAVGGSSFGGLASLWLALHHADTFGAALVVSPSLWWDDEFALRDVRASEWRSAARPRLWLDMGAREGEGNLAAARRLRDGLLSRGWSADAGSLAYLEDPEGGHDELSWAARFEAMLRFLYGPAASPPRARSVP